MEARTSPTIMDKVEAVFAVILALGLSWLVAETHARNRRLESVEACSRAAEQMQPPTDADLLKERLAEIRTCFRRIYPEKN